MSVEYLIGTLRARHEQLLEHFTSRKMPDVDEVKGLIGDALTAAPSIDYIEAREELRTILGRWANYLVFRDQDYPDIDIDRPGRRPRRLKRQPPPSTFFPYANPQEEVQRAHRIARSSVLEPRFERSSFFDAIPEQQVA